MALARKVFPFSQVLVFSSLSLSCHSERERDTKYDDDCMLQKSEQFACKRALAEGRQRKFMKAFLLPKGIVAYFNMTWNSLQ